MAKRRRKDDEAGSLDSLLDTMTNVVGILVILLTVVKLDVKSGVERIKASIDLSTAVSEDEVTEAKKEAEALKKLLEEIQNTDPAVLAQRNVQLSDLQKLTEQLKKDIKDIPPFTIDVKKTQQVVDERKKKSEMLEQKIDEGAKEKAKLMALLDETPIKKAPPPKVINLPNPRPAPKGIQPAVFICREGRIFYMDLEEHKEKAHRYLKTIFRSLYRGTPPKAVQCNKVIESFNSRFRGDRFFEYKLRAANYTVYIDVKRRGEVGETTEKIASGNSLFLVRARKLDPKKFYAKFYVWPDSFETYIEARKKTDSLGLLAGWVPQGGERPWTIHWGLPFTCADNPRPKPKPRDPNAPPPPKKPPPPPPDDID